jgi:hypothetical protein
VALLRWAIEIITEEGENADRGRRYDQLLRRFLLPALLRASGEMHTPPRTRMCLHDPTDINSNEGCEIEGAKHLAAMWAKGEGPMTDVQIFTVAVAVIFPLSMLIYSNSRISEAKETIRAEIATGFARMSSEIQSLQAQLKIHELEHHSK